MRTQTPCVCPPRHKTVGQVHHPGARAAFPGAVDDDGQPVTAGSTTVLSKAAAKPIVPLLRPTGVTFERTFAWGSAAPTVVTVIEPFVVEVEADASAQTGVHASLRTPAPSTTGSGPRRSDLATFGVGALARCGQLFPEATWSGWAGVWLG